ncbi:MAG TPA: LamG domain-containing protein, partial [Verrucomicrobiae bacterium]|nr:LamG domain-containing protein [Verrucomicrobiae bacterium]
GGTAANNLGLGLGISNYVYTVFTDDTNLTTTPVKFTPTFASSNAVTADTVIASNSFETTSAGIYTNGQTVETYSYGSSLESWIVATNEVGVITDAALARNGTNVLALTSGRITNTFPTVAGNDYQLIYWIRGCGLTNWWPGDDNTDDIINTNDGTAVNMSYDDGEVARAFTFNAASDSSLTFAPNVGNFGTNDFTIDFWIKTTAEGAAPVALLEKRPGCDHDLSFWGIRLNSANGVPGHLVTELDSDNAQAYVLLEDKTVVNDGNFHHVAVTRHGLVGGTELLNVYVDGNLDSSTNALGIANLTNTVTVNAGTSVCEGSDGSTAYTGDLDELDFFNRALSPAEVHAIYAAGSAGKYNTNSLLPNFQVTIDGYSTNVVILTNYDGPWRRWTNSFTATNTQVTVELAGNDVGVLFDDVQFVGLPHTNYNNYYLPEEPLTPFIGEDPQGCWTLDVWDTRTDSLLTNNGVLLSWDLQMTSSSTNVNLIVLTNRVPTNGLVVAANSILYFAVDVPLTANFATNILSNVVSGKLNLLFNQTALPAGGMPGDVELLSGIAPAGKATLAAQGAPPPLVPGKRYYLGVQNPGSNAATFSLEVDFDISGSNTNIYALSNNAAVTTNNIAATGPDFYLFTVPTNATMVTFQLLNPANAELDLYARSGLPVPGPFNFDYQSRNTGTNDQFIVVTTNSEPVPLPIVTTNTIVPISPTTWYLSVYNPAGVPSAGYTIVATYVTNVATNVSAADALDLIPLANTNAYTTNAVPGFPTNFLFSFTITGNPPGVQFVVTNLSGFGNVQLLADTNFPTPEHSYSASYNTGTGPQVIAFGTNANLPSLNGTWYLAVPNTSSNNPVTYSITASTLTNATVVSQPFFVGANVSAAANQFSLTWDASPGQSYTVQVSSNLTTWSTVTTTVAQSNTVSFTDTVPVSTQTSRFFRLSSP